MSPKQTRRKTAPPPIYILSGGTGSSGRQIVETALAQFPAFRAPVVLRNHVRTMEQAEAVVMEAKADGGAVVHTLVDGSLRKSFIRLARKHGVAAIDLMGPLLEQLAGRAGAEPLGQPGLYRKLREEYFDRVEAIDFAVSHDDGSGLGDLLSADVVILGVSRCGKTPLCMYLAAHGWKAANIPIVKGIAPPDDLRRVDRRRVVGLTIGHKRLLEHRKKREKLLGDVGATDYAGPSAVFEELEFANRIYREGGFSVVDVTDKPVEIVADEVVGLIVPGPGKGQGRSMPALTRMNFRSRLHSGPMPIYTLWEPEGSTESGRGTRPVPYVRRAFRTGILPPARPLHPGRGRGETRRGSSRERHPVSRGRGDGVVLRVPVRIPGICLHPGIPREGSARGILRMLGICLVLAVISAYGLMRVLPPAAWDKFFYFRFFAFPAFAGLWCAALLPGEARELLRAREPRRRGKPSGRLPPCWRRRRSSSPAPISPCNSGKSPSPESRKASYRRTHGPPASRSCSPSTPSRSP